MRAEERRKHVRIPVDLAATVAVGGEEPVTATIANFSAKGIFLCLDVSRERSVHVSFVLRPDHQLCEASGKVAWQGPRGVGIQFDQCNDAYVTFIDELAKAFKAPSDRVLREVLERLLGEPDVEID